jgi:hypothetical protein
MVDINGSIKTSHTVGTLPDFSEKGLPQALSLQHTHTSARDRHTKHAVHQANLDFAAAQIVQVVMDF